MREKPKRRWFQFGLVEFLFITTAIGIICFFCALLPVSKQFPNGQGTYWTEIWKPNPLEIAIRIGCWSLAAIIAWICFRSIMQKD